MSNIKAQLQSLFEGEDNFIANASNFASFIFHNFRDLNWAGFYLFDGRELVLGPFQGRPACIRIALGKGVCGTSAEKREVLIVDDVHQFPGHIACDGDSMSEIVIPIISNNELVGVLDIDSPITSRFSDEDRLILEEGLAQLIEISDFEALKRYFSK